MPMDLFKKLMDAVAELAKQAVDETVRKAEAEQENSVAGKPETGKSMRPVTEERKKEIRQGLQRFKLDMMKFIPFYGDILMKVTVTEDEQIQTAQTDGREIRYNPAFFATLSEGERNYVLMHEVMHILLLHWKRHADRDAGLWNVACDFVVNQILDRMKWDTNRYRIAFSRPKEGCFLDDNNQWQRSAEEHYAELLKKNKGRKRLQGYKGELKGRAPGDLLCTEVLSEGDTQLIEQSIRQLVRETIKRRGTGGSGYFPRELLLMGKSKRLPWNTLLYEFLQQREDEESSYLTPERKYIHMDLIIPGVGRTEDELEDIWAFVDSSGSISDDELGQFLTQLCRIAGEFHCRFNIAYWDTEVTDVYRNVRREKIAECKPNHSGGTDINCVYKYIQANRIKPGVMLILTDGYFGRLEKPAGSLERKTILVISENGMDFDRKNGIGKVARL